MAERNCKKCFHYKACKEVASHNVYADINYTESQCENFICADDVVKVVRCKDCKFRGTDDCLNSYYSEYEGAYVDPMDDDDFCSYGERRKENAEIH